jgi:hypothetical protein
MLALVTLSFQKAWDMAETLRAQFKGEGLADTVESR